MQGKPGAIIRASEFDKIVAFLVYDSKVRKTGAAKESWKTARQKLLGAGARVLPRLDAAEPACRPVHAPPAADLVAQAVADLLLPPRHGGLVADGEVKMR